jgi:hypothetical protein
MRKTAKRTATDPFDEVRIAGLQLPSVAAVTKYDGSPLLKLGGAFLAGLATHPTAEPDTLVVRIDPEEREALLDDAPETYYLTDYYRRYPVVLARLSRLDRRCATCCRCRGTSRCRRRAGGVRSCADGFAAHHTPRPAQLLR